MYVIEENKLNDSDKYAKGEFLVGYYKPNGGFCAEGEFKWEWSSELSCNKEKYRESAQDEAIAFCTRLNGMKLFPY